MSAFQYKPRDAESFPQKPVSDKPVSRKRPKDAASLLLIDRSQSKPRVLMGRRNAKLVFMPGKYVFPGGRTDLQDGSISSASELLETDQNKLLASMGSRPSMRRARALGLCAIRETFEETGLRLSTPVRVGDSTVSDYNHPEWSDFLKSGDLPHLSKLRYFARAITPPHHVRRFDTRFFMAFRDTLPDLHMQELKPSGELEDLSWLTFDQALNLDILEITESILKHAQVLLDDNQPSLPASIPVVQYRPRYGRYHREVI
ncbi:NUDIX hydrolase [Paenochrobactrum sp. BZR 588]|uniref:NUDIX hydrolase n=1 Tax=unclassified Paenochrobactrum TaxID=2639760 RepID=UPI003854BC0B